MSDSTNNTNCNANEIKKFPEWIQAKKFEVLLKSLYADFEEIVDFKVNNALAPGENYCTIMLKVDIDVMLRDCTIKSTSFMLKIGQDSEIFDEFMKNHDVFKVETGMYRLFVPEFEKLYADVGMKVKFGAQFYELPVQQKFVLLENLKLQGFRNTNRLDGLDRKHTKSVLKKLAQWHAASAVRISRQGPFPRDYMTGYLKAEGYKLINDMFVGTTKTLLECIKEYTNSELYYDKVVKLQNQITDEMYKNLEPDLSEFNVLNHGDCWSNNIMFKYDADGNILETFLIDFQTPRYGSPAIDLLYFLLSSTKLEIKLQDFDYFIKFYHDHLVESLNMLSYSQAIPSLKEIHQMIYKYGLNAYVTATTIMAAVLCDPTDNATLDNFVSDSEDGVIFKKQMFSNNCYRSHMEVLLPWMLYKGFLDC